MHNFSPNFQNIDTDKNGVVDMEEWLNMGYGFFNSYDKNSEKIILIYSFVNFTVIWPAS